MIKLKLTNKSCAPILMVRILSFCPHNRSQKVRFIKRQQNFISNSEHWKYRKRTTKNTTKQEGIMVGKNEDDCMPRYFSVLLLMLL